MKVLNKAAEKVAKIPEKVTNHLVGENHTPRHRKMVGFVIVWIGVLVAKSGGIVEYHIVHFITDGIGYLIHGIGAIPFVEGIIKNEKAKHEQ